MKKTIRKYVLLPMLLSVTAFTHFSYAAASFQQMKTQEAIYKMKAAMGKFIAAELTFTFEARNSSGEVLTREKGLFLVQGDAFKMSTGSYAVYCNASTKWIYDLNGEEITIFSHDVKKTTFLDNPFVVLKNLHPDDYRLPARVGMEQKVLFNEKCYGLVLNAKEKKSEFKTVTVFLQADTFLPTYIVYENQNGDVYHLDILSFVHAPERNLNFFMPDREILDNPNTYIVDMR